MSTKYNPSQYTRRIVYQKVLTQRGRRNAGKRTKVSTFSSLHINTALLEIMATSHRNPPSILGDNRAVLYQAMMNEHIPDIAPEKLDESLTIELAALVHNGQYNHARHLYRRYHDSHNTNCFTADNMTIESVFPMFYLLWKALEPLFLIHALEVNHFYSNRESCKSTHDIKTSSMFSFAKVYDHLKSCQLRKNEYHNSKLLESLTSELAISIRDKILFMIESGGFEAICDSSVASLLGFSDNQSAIEFCKNRGWEVESGDEGIYLFPFSRERSVPTNIGEKGKSKEKIEQLTRLVGFMEVERLNA